MDNLEPLRYPVGRAPRDKGPLTASERAALIDILERAPAGLRSLAAGLDDRQLDTPYRSGGWTIRQVIHHLPDSHMNAYVRMKVAVTEDAPAIKTYEEARWAELPEAKSAPIAMSLDLDRRASPALDRFPPRAPGGRVRAGVHASGARPRDHRRGPPDVRLALPAPHRARRARRRHHSFEIE